MKRALTMLVWVGLLAGGSAAAWHYREPIATELGLTKPQDEQPEPEPDTKPAGDPSAKQDPNRLTVSVEDQKKMKLQFGPAERRELVKPVMVPGTTSFDERRVTHLRPRAQGRVLSIAVQPGDHVKAGDTLATVDAAALLDARNGMLSAQASLGEAKATAAQADTQYKRGMDQLKFGGVAQAEVERRRADLAKAEAAVQSADAQVQTFSAQYERLAPARDGAPGTSAITTPIGGVVTALNITLGEIVDTGTDALVVADPSPMLVLANLYVEDINLVKSGDEAAVTVPPGETAAAVGRVQSVNAAIDSTTGAAPARIEVPNPEDRLRANMYVSVKIAADLGRQGITIPATAVQQTEEGPVAFVRTGDDAFERRTLALGLERSDWVEVRQGVREGETVATAGSFGLKAILLRSLLGSTD